MNVTIGGERLGSGPKQKAYLHNYERSTHDLSYTWRTTMASGTLVPFMTQVALPGDTFDIELNASVLTHPTIGPLFGSYKVQLDVFQVPFRLYLAQLHLNMLDIGRDMSQILLPQVMIRTDLLDKTKDIDNQQVNPSSLLAYLGIRGAGQSLDNPEVAIMRSFNAIPLLAYWDIYKNYYANKQEGIGAMIHKSMTVETVTLTTAVIKRPNNTTLAMATVAPPVYAKGYITDASTLELHGTGFTYQMDPSKLVLTVKASQIYDNNGLPVGPTVEITLPATELFQNWNVYPSASMAIGYNPTTRGKRVSEWGLATYQNTDAPGNYQSPPEIFTFPLKNIDDMRIQLLKYTTGPTQTVPFMIDYQDPDPYATPLRQSNPGGNPNDMSIRYTQEGLALKTYNSDLLNNWISTAWIDGADGITQITKITTAKGYVTVDEIQLARKVYDMLNRIAISGGTYDDWLNAVYTHERTRSAENPMYLGGLIKQVVFQEVISNAAAGTQPLGTLAGRGTLSGKHKGGKIVAKVDEPSYLIGIVSITPNVDYSQGNNWDMNLRSINDLHKPALDQIGFQNLLTDQMAWWDTKVDMGGAFKTIDNKAVTPDVPTVAYRSAGKQPAWVNYMTNVNRCYGNFADATQQMWMTLNRRYTPNFDANGVLQIRDLTTYIDPRKFNTVFADTRMDAQNFWVQIALGIEARRKMSAKVMPNL